MTGCCECGNVSPSSKKMRRICLLADEPFVSQEKLCSMELCICARYIFVCVCVSECVCECIVCVYV